MKKINKKMENFKGIVIVFALMALVVVVPLEWELLLVIT